MTRKQVIKQALAEGKDPHTATAMWFHDVEELHVTRSMRMSQKTINFGYLYGLGAEQSHEKK